MKLEQKHHVLWYGHNGDANVGIVSSWHGGVKVEIIQVTNHASCIMGVETTLLRLSISSANGEFAMGFYNALMIAVNASENVVSGMVTLLGNQVMVLHICLALAGGPYPDGVTCIGKIVMLIQDQCTIHDGCHVVPMCLAFSCTNTQMPDGVTGI